MWILAVALTALAGAFVLQPTGTGKLYVPLPFLNEKIVLPDTCLSRTIFGLTCPGCGLTRSFVHAARGEFRQSWQCNPLGPALFAVCLLQIPYRIIEYTGLSEGWRIWSRGKEYLGAVIWVLVAGLIGSWVIRMLFSDFAPW
ncbi:MAG: DUF2752 domain-containing protein [Thermodesulfobacteriota bacterium]